MRQPAQPISIRDGLNFERSCFALRCRARRFYPAIACGCPRHLRLASVWRRARVGARDGVLSVGRSRGCTRVLAIRNPDRERGHGRVRLFVFRWAWFTPLVRRDANLRGTLVFTRGNLVWWPATSGTTGDFQRGLA